MLREIVELVPPTWKPRVPDTDSEPFVAKDEVATELTSPAEPIYREPCVRDVSLREDENVEDAVENRPPVNPIVVEVLAPYDVNGRI